MNQEPNNFGTNGNKTDENTAAGRSESPVNQAAAGVGADETVIRGCEGRPSSPDNFHPEIEPEENSGSFARDSAGKTAPTLIEHQGADFSVTTNALPDAGDDTARGEASAFPGPASPTRPANLPVVADVRRRGLVTSSPTDDEIKEANERKELCEKFLGLRVGGYSGNQAAMACGKSPSYFSGDDSMLARYQREGFAGLLPQRPTGALVGDLTAQIEALAWFLPAAQFFYLITNRTKFGGSVPEAIRRVISLPNIPQGWQKTIRNRLLKKIGMNNLPVCPDVLRETILARERAGQPLVPDRIAKAITRVVNKHVIEAYRRPHEAGLNNLQSPGTMTMVRRHGCEPMFARAGDIMESDDGSINFPVCIPWTSPNGGLITETPCSANFGVIVGRFQWLRAIDVATRFRPGWVFVARSRGGFRGADVLTLLHGLTLQHGAWEEYRFERGVFKSGLVKRAIELLGSRLHTVISPHSKPFIEGGFNQDWTKLSVHFPQCDIGRYQGDTEEANKVVQACRAGRTDPRRLFPMLADALAAFTAITEEENRTLVKSRNSGQWVPETRWQREASSRPLRRVEESMMFMFSPYAMEWKVKGMLVGGRVPIFEDMSVPFDFSAPWLQEFSGARLRLHFDPTAPKCFATPVLLQDWQGHRAGEVLPHLQQINETTGYIRMVLGWGDDIGTAGLKAKQQAAVAMRREVRTVMPGGRSGYSKSEVKALDGTGILQKDGDGNGGNAGNIQHSTFNVERRTSEPSTINSQPSTAEKRAAQRADLEKFERENQHLLV